MVDDPQKMLSELARLGARLIIQRAVEEEFDQWLGRRLIPEVIAELDLERSLDQPLGQLREQAARADDLLLGPRTRQQLV